MTLHKWVHNNFNEGSGKEGMIGTRGDKNLYMRDLFLLPFPEAVVYYYWLPNNEQEGAFCDAEVILQWPDGTLKLFFVGSEEMHLATHAAWGDENYSRLDLSNRQPLAVGDGIMEYVQNHASDYRN
jgi:hypothetical protein